MSTTRDVDLGGLHVTGSWQAPGGTVEAQLAVYTKTGQARIAVVDERALVQLIAQAADALRKLDTHRRVTEEHNAQYVPPGLERGARAVDPMKCPRTGCTLPYLHAGGHGA